MIKEYFTDGLIGLAILLSLFRTDLGGINNLINYPEVQDVILGQTAAYLPVNFHNYVNSPHVFNNQKYIDFDNGAFSAWYQNIQNLPRYRRRRDTEIEAFLVNAPLPSPSIITLTESHFSTETTNVNGNGEEAPHIVSPTLPLEGANSFQGPEVESETTNQTSEPENDTQTLDTESETTTVDITFLFTNPFPGCNLTKEDLDLIEVLWRQDVDLGVGKEVYDQNLRLELEKEKEHEVLKQQERDEAQALSKEKEERQKKEHASRWLKENFMRDGETGEWVRLQNQTLNGTADVSNGTVPAVEGTNNNNNEELLTLEAALDYFTTRVDFNLLDDLDLEHQAPDLAASGFTDAFLESGISREFLDQQPNQSALPMGGYLEHQDSLEENWNGLVEYLNMAAAGSGPTAAGSAESSSALHHHGDSGNNNSAALVASSLLSSPEEHLTSAMAMNSDLQAIGSELDTGSSDFLLQNATMPTPDGNMTGDYGNLNSMESLLAPLPPANLSGPVTATNSSGPPPPPTSVLEDRPDDNMDWDLSDLALLNNLASGSADLADLTAPSGSSAMVDDLDLNSVSDIFLNIDTQALANRDVEDLSDCAGSVAGSTPHQELSDAYEGLEGAIGGADYSPDLSDPFSKVSRLSQSSDDSGFVYQGGFSSSSSAGSSYAGSPASSSHGSHNVSQSHNDTELDPAGSHASVHTTARTHVAHNHTYNTPPGQTPREVKKYMTKEPSRKGPHSRDERKASELKVPFTMSEIIDSPVDTFNEMLTKYKLNEPQLALIRDIRRRGKNKVAAQNCRKRKVGVIVTLSDEMMDLQKMRDRLMSERAEMEREKRRMNDKFGLMYTHIFQSLRDEAGQPYDPNMYSLQQSSDGNVFLVPRNMSSSSSSSTSASSKGSTNSSPKDSSSSSSSSSEGSGFSRKRRALD